MDEVRLAASEAIVTLEISITLIDPGRAKRASAVVETNSASFVTSNLVPSGVMVTESG